MRLIFCDSQGRLIGIRSSKRERLAKISFFKKFLPFLLAGSLLTLWGGPVFSTTIEEAQGQKSYYENKIDEINRLKSKEEARLKSAETKKKDILDSQKRVESEYQKLLSELNEAVTELNSVNEDIRVAQSEYNTQMELFKTRLRAMYKTSFRSKTDILLESKNLTDFFKRLKYLSLLTNRDKDIIDKMTLVKKNLETKQAFIEQQKNDTQQKATATDQTRARSQASRATLESDIRKISDKLDQYEKQVDQLYQKSVELDSVIKKMQDNRAYTGGSMLWPLPGYNSISSPFGYRVHPILKKYKMHTGIDIHGAMGASIVAANAGVVKYAGWYDGYGNTAILDHGGGITTLYAHASRLTVSVGQSVKKGAEIAKVGSTGLSTGPHLHFEVRVNSAVTDPMQGYLSK